MSAAEVSMKAVLTRGARAALILVALIATARAGCPSTAPFPTPTLGNATGNQTEKCYVGFALNYGATLKVPLWVEYVLTSERAYGCLSREGLSFKRDPELNGADASNRDYTNAGYDRGHMAPAGDMEWDRQVLSESFYFSNIAPQLPELNRGPWKAIEELVRLWGAKRGTLLVITGPIFEDQGLRRLPRGVAIPSAFFKTVYDPRTQESVSFVAPADASGAPDLKSWETSIGKIQKRTNLTWALPVAHEFTAGETLWPADPVRNFRSERQRRCNDGG
jgi:endonuclease G, mitochondrial